MFSLLLRVIYRQRSVIYSLLKVAVVIVLFIVSWTCFRNAFEDSGSKSYKELRERLVELQGENVGAKLDALQRLYGEDSCTAAYNYYQSVHQKNGLAELAYDIARGRTAQFDLAGVVRGYGEVGDSQKQFMNVLSVMYDSHKGDADFVAEADKLVKQHAAVLEDARKKGGDTWRAAGSSVVGAMMYRILQQDETYRSDADWELYCRQHDWMQTAIPMLFAYPMAAVDEMLGSGAGNMQETVERLNPEIAKRFVEMCATYPEFMRAAERLAKEFEEDLKDNVCKDEEGVDQISALAASMAYMYRVFDLYGKEVDALCHSGLNAVEVLDVLLCNLDLFREDREKKRMAFFFKDVEDMRKNSGMWNYARCTPHSLRLFRANPNDSPDVIQTYAHAGIPTLLVACSMREDGSVDMDALCNAVTAQQRYKEIAVYVMNVCAEDPRFMQALHKDWRSVAYMAKRVDDPDSRGEALDMLCSSDGIGWINKELKADGTPVDVSWYEYIPGGAIVKVVSNFACGVPCEWSEVGWAIVDVAEGAALVASMVAAPGVGPIAVKAATQAGRSAAKTVTRGVATTAMERATRSAGKVGSGLLRRMALSIKNLGVAAAKGSVKVMGKIAKPMLRVLKNPRAYRWAGMGLLGMELGFRTIPHMYDIAEGLSSTMTKAFGDAAAGLAAGTAQGIMDVVGGKLHGLGVNAKFFIGLISILSSVFLFYLFFIRRNKSQRKQLSY